VNARGDDGIVAAFACAPTKHAHRTIRAIEPQRAALDEGIQETVEQAHAKSLKQGSGPLFALFGTSSKSRILEKDAADGAALMRARQCAGAANVTQIRE
jgi:hypothetical protein